MDKICVITSKYPTKYNMSALVFVQQFVWTLADMGIECTVISPVPINIDIIPGLKLPYKMEEITSNKSVVTVYFPRYIGFGQRNLHLFNTAAATLETFDYVVKRTVMKLPNKPDAIYGHFITPSGISAARIGRSLDIPSFIAYGESSPWSIKNIGVNKINEELNSISGIVSVSTSNKDELIKIGVANEDKIGVFPNAIRSDRFYPHDKKESRLRYGISPDAFVIAFVGHFIKRKGIDKVMQAVNNIDNVFAIYAGKGGITPEGRKTLHANRVNPEDLPWFYCAADVFVLPTQNEGCCNAIVEAMACGLPIISSKLPFNNDILNDYNSIQIDPNSLAEITSAIVKIKDNKKLRDRLSLGSLRSAKKLMLSERVNSIIKFMEEKSQ